MSNTIAMAVVESLKSLLEVVSGNGLGEGTRGRYEVKQFTTASQVEHNVRDFLGFFRLSSISVHARAELDLLEHVFVYQALHDLDFLQDQLESLLRQVRLENLNGDLLLVYRVVRQLHLTGATGAESFKDGIVTERLIALHFLVFE